MIKNLFGRDSPEFAWMCLLCGIVSFFGVFFVGALAVLIIDSMMYMSGYVLYDPFVKWQWVVIFAHVYLASSALIPLSKEMQREFKHYLTNEEKRAYVKIAGGVLHTLSFPH